MTSRRNVVLTLVLVAAGFTLAACPPAAPPPKPANLAKMPAEVRWRLASARGAGSYLKMDLPVVISGTRITVLPPVKDGESEGGTAAATGWRGSVEIYSTHPVRGAVEGPMVDQLTGQARQSADAGSYLVPLARKGEGESYEVAEPMPLFLRVEVSALTAPGTYRIPVQMAAPGRAEEEALLEVEVADVAVPTDPRVLGVATTTVEELARIYPESFGTIAGQYLDRSDIDHHAAVAQLDALVKAARAQGVALFVEDIIPATRVDELGQVTLDWDAYDRLMQPYMDGTAFEDRVPLPVWLAPVPPRRIRDSSTQLWQYIDLCAKHFAAKGWVAVPAFLHPAVAAEEGVDASTPAELEKLRAQVSEMMRLHMPREMLAVSAPGADVPHGQLWTVNDGDPRLPPAGLLANEYSVRVWPWVCVARGNTTGANGLGGSPTGVKGFVWRDAICGTQELAPNPAPATDASAAAARPLLVVDAKAVLPTLRMVWLHAGLNDAALLGLLEKRADTGRTGMIAEILAGMAGRTGIPDERRPAGATVVAPTGFLYAGWPADKEIWAQVTSNLLKFIQASDPGTRAAAKPDDAAYQTAKLWLAGTRRPVARIAGYEFALRQGMRGGDILDARLHLRVENPVDAAAEMDLRFSYLPGDFEMLPAASAAGAPPGSEPGIRRRNITLPAASSAEITVPLAGHISELMESPGPTALEIAERFNGAVLQLPVQLPVYRIHGLDEGQSPPKLDGKDDDWPMDNQTRVFGEMKVATRYLARPDLLAGVMRTEEKAASVRWTYDDTYLYMLARCPQDGASDDRNTEWPVTKGAMGSRWWGTDGLQIELGALPPAQRPAVEAGKADPYERLVKIAFKPAGVVLVETGTVVRDAKGAWIQWKEGSPGGSPLGVKYGISTWRADGRVAGYVVEAAVPRAWVDVPLPAPTGSGVAAAHAPAWRLNVLRHRAGDLVSSSWSGPVVEDDDVQMMGALLGE